MEQQIREVLMHHGFTDPQADARAQIDAAARGLVGTGRYATVEELLNDLTNHGSFITPDSVTVEVARVFFDAAGYHGSDIISSTDGDHLAANEVEWLEG